MIEKLARMLAQQGIKVTQRGTEAYCRFNDRTGKPEQINLPVIPPDPSEEFVNALHGYLDHEISHALLTTPGDWTQAAQDNAAKNGGSLGFRHTMINIVEDIRIENTIPQRLPGTLPNLEKVRQFLIDKLWGPQLDKFGDWKSEPDMYGKVRTATFVAWLRAQGGHNACVMWSKERGLDLAFEPLMKQIPDLTDRLKALQSTKEAAELAELIIQALREPKRQEPPQEPPEEPELTFEPPPPPESGSDEPSNPEDLPDLEDVADQEDEPKKGGKGKKPKPEKDEEPSGDKDADEKPDAGDDDSEGDGVRAPSPEEGDEEPAPGEGEDESEAADTDEGGEPGSGATEDEEADEPEGTPEDEGDEGDEGDEAGGKDEGRAGDDDDQVGDGNGRNITLREALRSLLPEQRRALFLYNKRKMKTDEIATDMKISEGDAERHLRDGRRRLALIMKGNK